MVVAASQNPPGVEAPPQSVPFGMQGSRHAGPNPYRGPSPSHLERQQQGNWPFFYVQPSQPYLPCQWPMPMPYVPYGGFPGLGYGMVLPPFPPASYVEAPGYILPHTQLHMVDYPAHENAPLPWRPAHTRRAPPEEVRIECSGSPSAVKITHSKETTELASNADGELLQCNMGAADVVLRCFQPVPFGGDEELKSIKDLSHFEDPCPDILMVSCPSNGSVSTLDGSIVSPVEPVNSTLVQGDPSLVKSAQDICGNSKNIHFKILHLPFELQCLDELRQMEASVWSVESLMPYMPTSEWMMQNSLMTPGKPSLATVTEVPAENPLQLNHSPVDATQSLLEAGTVIEFDGQDSMTSLESLPPFLPLVSRLADFGNAYYDKLSSNLKISNPDNWAKGQPEAHQDTKVQSGHQSPNTAPKKLKEETTSVVMSGLSDQEHCAAHFPDSPLKHKVRTCKSCSVKHGSDICSEMINWKSLLSVERWRDTDQRFNGEKSWRGGMQGSDSESTKSGGKMRTRNKQKQCTQSLEVHRRDTRY
ncbi:hypothetical protein AMELA_G00107890 [Ameiurus melas]|uniref:Uncharacterized protein n=1 Tax=Ameiurus melas TaxID=219545 RepID=A0A7J6APB6_AMEME|nr:hypothetical protein AMELA_G00107890 [Ameiurus melas]